MDEVAGKRGGRAAVVVGVVLIVALVTAAVVAYGTGRSSVPPRALTEPGFATAYPVTWTLRRTRTSLAMQYELSSTGRSLDSNLIPPPGTIGITIVSYPSLRLAAFNGPSVLSDSPEALLGQTSGIPDGETDARTVAPAHAIQLGGVPAAAISYRYSYHGKGNLQTDVASRHGATVILLELDVAPNLAAAGTSTLDRILAAWHWSSSPPPSAPVRVRGAHSSAPLGAFAGYTWDAGQVQSVGATWRVPRIDADSSPGRAGTWIGATATVGARNQPFIQIGTNEERLDDDLGDSATYRYYAFWSATDKGYHPAMLFGVHPGDKIAARMTLGGGRWQLAITDRTSGAHAGFHTGLETGWRFDEAEWLQEDITDTYTQTPFPYPSHLSNLRFEDLQVNSQPPDDAGLVTMWMSENGRYLAPGPVRDDAFSYSTPAVSPAGQTYLDIAGAEDRASQAFEGQINDWTSSTLRSVIVYESARFVAALRVNILALGHSSWPAQVRPLIHKLLAQSQSLLGWTQTIVSEPTRNRNAWITGYEQDSAVLHATAELIRRTLGLPSVSAG